METDFWAIGDFNDRSLIMVECMGGTDTWEVLTQDVLTQDVLIHEGTDTCEVLTREVLTLLICFLGGVKGG